MRAQQTPTHVAELATQRDQLADRGLVLIGCFGTPEAPRALLRLTSGDMRSVEPGDRIAGRVVAAISADGLALVRGDTVLYLRMP
ncbi:hypothetical protein [Shimia sp.]|uniref:hypothetical protein n=1 Tax=Shimia sp. TaxID=1954381 RepID=UPI00356AF628